MIRMSSKGSFRETEDFLKRMLANQEFSILDKYGQKGVAALRRSTPKDSTDTADSWYYQIVKRRGYFAIHWLNSNLRNPGNIPVAIMIQYGHGTRNGGYVQGRDYINPAMRPIFDQMATDMWKEVTR